MGDTKTFRIVGGPDLDGWKAIATCIRRSVDTAQRWAAAGMPVRFVGRGNRPRVSAYSDEILKWHENQFGRRASLEEVA